ncbi:LysR substrate-binding domain-containing protein [Thalassospira lucentensis]|uniref:LysR family transcriptional regulator n=1 Tax=Thalassospira lucentensis TaxID=168935 RepID=UPI003AA8CC1B
MVGRKVANGTFPGTELDLGAVSVFVAVAEAGSFVSGGKERGLSRSAAGKAVTRLEAYLGIRLFHRTTRRLSLTTEGHEFYRRCSQLLEDVAEAEASIRPDKSKPRGTLRLTVSDGYSKAIVIPYLSRFLKETPGLNVEISSTDRIVDLVEEGFDLAIRVGETVKNVQHVTQVIDRSEAHLYASPDYLDHHGMPQSFEELADHQRLVYGLGTTSTAWNLLDENQNPVRVDGQTYIRFDNGDAIRAAAICSMGICCLPSFMIKQELENRQLVRVLANASGEEIAIHAIYPSRRYLPTRVRLFIDGLKQFLVETHQTTRA